MEKHENLTFMELLLRILNNCLAHLKLCIAIVTIPTAIMFVLVMWVLEPTYRAEAVVTPPTSEVSLAGNIGKFMDGLDNLGSISSLLGKADNGTDIVWTYLNSWELHDMVIEKFDLVNHYEFDGKFHADMLKQFRKNFDVEINDEGMFKLTYEDEDYVLAAEVLNFMLAKADSMYNSYKTSQARISRQYIQERLEREEHAIDSLQEVFVKFQTENHFYDPEIQLEATMKYLSTLQGNRDMVAQELAFEKMERGENGRRYEELRKRLSSVDASMKHRQEFRPRGPVPAHRIGSQDQDGRVQVPAPAERTACACRGEHAGEPDYLAAGMAQRQEGVPHQEHDACVYMPCGRPYRHVRELLYRTLQDIGQGFRVYARNAAPGKVFREEGRLILDVTGMAHVRYLG